MSKTKAPSARPPTHAAKPLVAPRPPGDVALVADVRTTGDAPNGPYMTVSTVDMVGLMLYRWNVYSAHPAKPAAIRGG